MGLEAKNSRKWRIQFVYSKKDNRVVRKKWGKSRTRWKIWEISKRCSHQLLWSMIKWLHMCMGNSLKSRSGFVRTNWRSVVLFTSDLYHNNSNPRLLFALGMPRSTFLSFWVMIQLDGFINVKDFFEYNAIDNNNKVNWQFYIWKIGLYNGINGLRKPSTVWFIGIRLSNKLLLDLGLMCMRMLWGS